ncbi:MAG: GatB/YqeY domain-containing protein [Actinomycetota bacterium]
MADDTNSAPGAGSTKTDLQADLKTAMRARDDIRVATIRMVLAAITTEEVAGDAARVLTDEEVQGVLRREAKKRREAAAAFADGGRPERAERERAELVVIEKYLPAQINDEELAAMVSKVITAAGVTDRPGLGQVIQSVQQQAAGQADGGRVAAEVRRQLG